ncbi:MAG: class I SAM-dependent methyltransferase [Dehalococcoidia bacterium]
MPLEFKPDGIEDYAAAHSTPLPPLLRELTAETEQRTGALAGMLSGQLVGLLLQTLVAATGARRVLEIGMFTGFSAQMMANALPEEGRVVTCDVSQKAIAIAREFFGRSPHGRKIDVREGPALDTLRTLEGPFDFVFIDADKGNYINYYEAALPLLAPRGIIAVDNVLWSGNVLDPKDDDARAIVAFNAHVQADPRVTNFILTVRDGVMLIRRVP